MKKTMAVFALACGSLLLADEQDPKAKPQPVTVPSKPIQIGKVTVTGSIRTRLENWNWFEPGTGALSGGEPTYSFSGNLIRVMFSQSFKKFGWQVELAAPVLLGLPENAQVPGVQGALGLGSNYYTANHRNRNSAMIFPKTAALLFKGLGGPGALLKVGRYEFSDGSELTPKNTTLAALKVSRINMRLLGPFSFTHVGRSFDGLHYSRTDATTAANLSFVSGVATRGVFQTDGWGWNKIAFGYLSYTRPFIKKNYSAETRLFGLYYHDWRKVLKVDNRSAAARAGDFANIRIATFGAHSIHALDRKEATYDLLFWAAAQTGQWGRLDHRAGVVELEAGIQPKAKPTNWLKPWLRGGFTVSSGDKDPNDGKHGTFFQMLPTPRPFARFPFFNMMNSRDIYGALIVRPHPRLSISTEFHSLALGNRHDLWFAGGGAFQPWTFGYQGRNAGGAKALGNLYDISVDLKLSAATSLNFYFGHIQGLAVIRSIYPKGQSGNLGFVELTHRF